VRAARHDASGKLLITAMLCGIVAPALHGQAKAAPATASDKLSISVAPYDVASIRMHPSSYLGGMHITTGNGSMSAENATLRFLIRFAYDLPEKLLAGGPAWIDKQTFDIKAKTDNIADFDRKQLSAEQYKNYMALKQLPLQKLLEDRFQLKVHREDKELPFYALVATKGGIKIKPSDEKSDLKQATGVGYGGLYDAPGLRVTGKGEVVAVRVTLDQLAKYLTGKLYGELDRPVLNKTGLTGEYDFKLEWNPGSTLADDSSALSLFTAIQEQLGLKLVPQKGPVEVMVIDSAELPSEN
jgi:uncharacterized protein (TIGR03435 family)